MNLCNDIRALSENLGIGIRSRRWNTILSYLYRKFSHKSSTRQVDADLRYINIYYIIVDQQKVACC